MHKGWWEEGREAHLRKPTSSRGSQSTREYVGSLLASLWSERCCDPSGCHTGSPSISGRVQRESRRHQLWKFTCLMGLQHQHNWGDSQENGKCSIPWVLLVFWESKCYFSVCFGYSKVDINLGSTLGACINTVMLHWSAQATDSPHSLRLVPGLPTHCTGLAGGWIHS